MPAADTPASTGSAHRGTASRARRWIEFALYALLMAVSLTTFRNHELQGPNWLYPYFSGAAHLDASGAWRFSVPGYLRFKSLSTAEMRAYDFDAEGDEQLRSGYAANNAGLMYIVVVAKSLFPWLSYINATTVLQGVVHIATTLLLASFFSTFKWRLLFVLAYGANPVVAHVVTFPNYYFWQVIPSVMLLAFARWRPRPVVLVACYAVLLLAYATRPSLVLIVLLAAAIPVLRAHGRQRWVNAGLAAALVVGIGWARQPTKPWHTMYVGLGAYPNEHVAALSDDSGYLHFLKKTGITIRTDLDDGNYYDPVVRPLYFQTLKAEYFNIVQQDPLFVIRSAVLNFLQSFSFGYAVGQPAFNLFSALVGLVVLALLVVAGEWLVLGGLLAYAATYVWYFPPIAMYTFGAYSLLVFGGTRVLARVLESGGFRRGLGQLPFWRRPSPALNFS